MKTKLLLALALVLFAGASTSHAGWGCGRGGWGGGPRYYGGYGWGGGWGGGYCGPGFGIGFAAPVVVVRPQPVYYTYAQPVVYVKRTVAQSTLVRAQAQLARLGYYRGEVDGSFGPLTSRAIRQYQADYGLPITGVLDRTTLRTLGA